MVVLGRSSRAEGEVRLEECRRRKVPVAVVTGPGCLIYSLVLSHSRRGGLHAPVRAHRAILGPLARALDKLVPGVCCAGTSDLAFKGRKVSGNSMRSRRTHLLYHGTLLYDFPLELVEELLQMPPRQPQYRAGRTHREFLANLPLSASQLKATLRAVWQADNPMASWPRARTEDLVAKRYGRREWNLCNISPV